jgi:hypothetical protein
VVLEAARLGVAIVLFRGGRLPVQSKDR